jgi:hypothetical protein
MHDTLMSVKLDCDDCLDYFHPLAFAAKANSENTPTWTEAMYGPDADGFYEAVEQ